LLAAAVATQVRYAHIEVPNFDAVKRAAGPDAKEADYSRRAFTYLMGAGGAVATAHMAKSIVQDFLHTMSASARCLPRVAGTATATGCA
jgi:ubiquinol-cytochrome c reductase iron-sulfur subunit